MNDLGHRPWTHPDAHTRVPPYNGSKDPCDTWDGPCCCGAMHEGVDDVLPGIRQWALMEHVKALGQTKAEWFKRGRQAGLYVANSCICIVEEDDTFTQQCSIHANQSARAKALERALRGLISIADQCHYVLSRDLRPTKTSQGVLQVRITEALAILNPEEGVNP